MRSPVRPVSFFTTLLSGMVACAGGIEAQGGPSVDGGLHPADSTELRRDLEGAVDRYERSRRRFAPTDFFGRPAWGCDEYVGRMCLTLGEGSDWWFPEVEPERMREARDELLATLADGVRRLPGDPWVVGHLMLYLGEDGAWEDVLPWLDPCPPIGQHWCHALRGAALHASARYVESERAFEIALGAMDPGARLGWLDPGEVVRDDLRDHLDTLSGPALEAEVERFWRLSDPFLSVEGNDRRTAHLARRVVVELRYGARSAYRIAFKDDLEEVTLRYGWEVGWERRPSRGATTVAADATVVGHQHPYTLPWVAPEEAMLRPAGATARVWTPQSSSIPRTGYAPEYAPNTLPDGELHLFPRGRRTLVVAKVSMPADTSWHADHGHPPLPVPEAFELRPATSALFATDVEGHVVASDIRTHPTLIGVEREEILDRLPAVEPLRITLDTGTWMVSAEHLVPSLTRGARLRRGLRIEEVLLDEATLSDLIVLGSGPEPSSLEEALEIPMVRSVEPGAAFRVGWETWGLGGRDEAFAYTMTVTEEGGGVVDRLVGWLGLGGEDVVSDLSWSEEAQPTLGAHFRSVELTLPDGLDPGRYLLRLELRSQGRESLVSERALTVVPRGARPR